jgi:2-keto-4-pentenoate hydratase
MRVEPEVCLRVGEGGQLEAIAPALELVDFTTPPKDLFELLSSSILHVAAVVGEFVSPSRAEGLGTRWPRLEVTGQPVPPLGEGLVPIDLQESVDFVRDTLPRFGEALVAGDLILAGSYAAAVPPLERGARARAEFGPLGSVEVVRRA